VLVCEYLQVIDIRRLYRWNHISRRRIRPDGAHLVDLLAVRLIYPQAGPEFTPVPAAAPGPAPEVVRDVAALYRAQPRPGAAGRPWLRANMVVSLDGAASLHGRSGGLGGSADRMVFNILRSLADVILVGAGTARAERYKPVRDAQIWPELRAGRPPQPPIAIVTRSLDLSDCEPLLSAQAQTVVITTAEAAANAQAGWAPGVRVVVAGETRVDVGQAVSALVSLGFREILTEGGPRLLGQLTQAGLLDELCLTTSPVIAAGPADRIVVTRDGPGHPAAALPLELAHVLTDAGFLLSRYVRPAD
jgi:riboflavin biosynthesis pyrimidine reductase